MAGVDLIFIILIYLSAHENSKFWENKTLQFLNILYLLMVLPSICNGCPGVLVRRHLVCLDTNNYAELPNHIMKITPCQVQGVEFTGKLFPLP